MDRKTIEDLEFKKFTLDQDGNVAINAVVETSGGSSSFTLLSDTPNSYTGQAGKIPVVKSTEDGLEFSDILQGTDTKTVKVNTNDNSDGFLNDKIKAGDNITIDTIDDGNGNLNLKINAQQIDILGKADKVINATDGNFAGLDASGNLTDSGKKASDFANVNHTHTSSDISDFDTAVSNNSDVSTNTNARHTHNNKTLLDNLTDSGSGNKYLSDDGTYKTISGGTADITQALRYNWFTI